MELNNYITVKQYADSLGVSPSYIYKQYREYSKGERKTITFTVVFIAGVMFIVQ